MGHGSLTHPIPARATTLGDQSVSPEPTQGWNGQVHLTSSPQSNPPGKELFLFLRKESVLPISCPPSEKFNQAA